MLVFDNWRLLHGRGVFEGKRGMVVAYINREGFVGASRKRDLTEITVKTAQTDFKICLSFFDPKVKASFL